MELFEQTAAITLTGIRVHDFPNGIKEAFDELAKTFGTSRAFYGLSWMDDEDQVIYYALAEEASAGEGALQHYSTLTLEQGTYLTETVHDWMSKTDSIKDVFGRLLNNQRPGKDRPCVEWYRSHDEMRCMVKAL